MSYKTTNVTQCYEKIINPTDGSYYFDDENEEIYIAFNGIWSKMEILMSIDEMIRLNLLKSRKKKLEKLNGI